MLNKRILTLVFVVAFLLLLVGCLPGLTPTPPKGVISGRIMAPSSETTKDITGWIPVANATVTITDSEGVTHTVTSDEDGYYTFTDIAVNANTIITATGTVNGNTVIIKDVIPQAVATDEDYNAGTADAESTALALIVEELLEQGLDPGDIDLEEIQDSDNFAEVVEQVSSILGENGNVTTDPGLTETVSNVAEDIINPPEPSPEPSPPPVNHAPSITSSPNLTAIVGVEYVYDVDATDSDGDVLTYSLTVKPGSMAIDSGTGKIIWIPASTGSYDVTVEASDGKLSDTQNFTIIVSTVEITGIVVKPDEMTLVVGRSETIKSVTAIYEIKTGFEALIPLEDCTYASDATQVATVSNGVVTAVAGGTATITVTYAGKTDTIEVTVVLPVHNNTKDEYYDTIQAAIDDASDFDTIEVAAGTYDVPTEGFFKEIQIVDKSLTLLGAQADVSIVNGGRAGDESIIRGKETSWCVIRIKHSDVTVNGFTIENGKRGIAIQGKSPIGISNILVSYNCIVESGDDGIFRDNAAADVTITHNYIADNPRGIATNGGATTITDNMFYSNGEGISFNGIDPYSVYFPDYTSPNYPTIISDNTFTDDSTSITLRLDKGHQSITIEGNDITGASNVAIRTRKVYDVDIVNPAIHYNNVWNNEFGVNNQVTEINLDATYNWWGSEYGPKHNGFPVNGGDAVSDNVDYEHFLTNEY